MRFTNATSEYLGGYELDKATGLAVGYSLAMSSGVHARLITEIPEAEDGSPGEVFYSLEARVTGEFRRAG